nr:MAG TPA: hypothetical protein [Caudoviricetes sp.]
MCQDDRPLVSDDRVSVFVRSHTTIGPRISVITPSDVLSFTLSVLTTDCTLAISQRVSLRIVHTYTELNEGHATASGDDFDLVVTLPLGKGLYIVRTVILSGTKTDISGLHTKLRQPSEKHSTFLTQLGFVLLHLIDRSTRISEFDLDPLLHETSTFRMA